MKPANIPHFDLLPSAKAGVFVRNLHNEVEKGQHDTAAPHRDNHYLLLLATQGSCTFNLDFEEVIVAAPALLLIHPGQVHAILTVEAVGGWALAFEPSLFEVDFLLQLENGLSRPLSLEPHTPLYQQAVAVMGLMENVQVSHPASHVSRAMQGLLMALLQLIAGAIMTNTTEPKTKVNRGAAIEQAFNQLLRRYYKDWKQPAQYADELALSVSHLNDTIKDLTGSSVSAHIQQYAVLEAKRLLYFTNLSVKEIGYAVGYDEPVYFNKLFRKQTGLTPLAFRQKFRD